MIDTAPVLHWSEIYSVNIAALDRQHQFLFDTINELQDGLVVGHGTEIMHGVLQKLIQYATTHFEAEESLMAQYDFPDLATHRVEHEAFVRNIAKYTEDFRVSKTDVPASLLLFLQSWLKAHILKSDKAYSRFLNERGVS
jgi:hemerythrin-like metal-binding protein